MLLMSGRRQQIKSMFVHSDYLGLSLVLGLPHADKSGHDNQHQRLASVVKPSYLRHRCASD